MNSPDAKRRSPHEMQAWQTAGRAKSARRAVSAARVRLLLSIEMRGQQEQA